MYEIAGNAGNTVTRNDVKIFIKDRNEDHILEEINRKGISEDGLVDLLGSQDNEFFAATQTLTPIPELGINDPEDLYDMREGPSRPIRVNDVGGYWFRGPKNTLEYEEKRTKDLFSMNPINWRQTTVYTCQYDLGDSWMDRKYDYKKKQEEWKKRQEEKNG